MAGAVHGIAVWAARGQLVHGARAVASLVLPFARRRLRSAPQVDGAAATTIRFAPSILAGTLAAVAMGVSG
jgi:hypothetical protein